jgi:hypothetical protein
MNYSEDDHVNYKQQLKESGYASCRLCSVSFISINGILEHVKNCAGVAL